MWSLTKAMFRHLIRNYKFYGVIFLCIEIIIKLITANYTLSDKLYYHKGEETYTEVWNDRAECEQEMQMLKAFNKVRVTSELN